MIALDLNLPTRVHEAGRAAHAAQPAGFGCGWIPETTSDPFPVATSALLQTTSMRIGTAVAVAFARAPFVTAQAAWELSRCSDGRFTLGLGTQVKAHIERRFSGQWSEPAARLSEYIQAVRACWSAFAGEEPLRFAGRFYRADLLTDYFDPGPIAHPRIPVAIAGVNAGMGRLAGELCDGLICHPLHSRRYLEEVLVAAVSDGAASAGRSRSAIEVLVPVWVVTGTATERDAARDAIRQQIAFYGSTRTYRRVFEVHGWDHLPPLLHQQLAAGRLDLAAAAVTDEMVETFAVCAPVDGLAEAIRQRLGGLADRTMVYAPLPRAVGDLELEALASELAATP